MRIRHEYVRNKKQYCLNIKKRGLYLRLMEKVVETTTATFSMLEKDIMLIVMKEGAVVDVPEVKENYEATMQLVTGNRYATLVDALAYATITKEGREHSSAPEEYKNVIAQAVVLTSLANRILANFLMRFHQRKNNPEMKLFNDYDSALAWLKEKIANDGVENNVKKKSRKIPFLSSV